MRTYPVAERNESIYIWHDVEGRDPFFDAPDVFASFDDGSSAADYYPQQRLFREALELHPQYVLENGVDFAHFKFVHKTPIVPVFTRHDFDRTGVLRRLHHHLRGRRQPDDRRRQQRCRGDQRRARHRGDEELGHDRQPDHLGDHAGRREHLRRPVHGLHRPDARRADIPSAHERKAQEFGEEVIRQFSQDVYIWSPPALLGSARPVERRVRGLHRDPQVGQAVLSRRSRRQRRRACRPRSTNQKSAEHEVTSTIANPRLPGGDRQRRHRDDQAHRHRTRPRTDRIALLHSGEGRPRRRRDRRACAQSA